jgi:PAS domain S-box-containing protein
MGDRLSLRERLLLLMVAAILPLAMLLAWISVRELNEDIEHAQGQLKFAASLIASHQDRSVEAAQNLLATIGAMPQMRNPERNACQKFFETLHGLHPIYANFGIVDTTGKVVCHAGGRNADFTLADRPYFAKVMAERRFVMGAPAFGKVSGRFIVPFAQPVFDGQRVTAVAFAALDLGNASGALGGAELPDGASVVVTDRRGLVLMEHPSRPGSVAGKTIAHPTLLEAARLMAAGTGEWSDADGETRIHAFTPSRLVGDEGFLAAVSLDKAQVSGSMLDNLRGHVLALCISLLIGLLAAWWIGGRVIVKPANRILGAVQRLEQGLLNARVPLPSGPRRGEFSRIGAAFNLMAESLQLRRSELETELGRSRSAYGVLELVLNSMQDGLIAVTSAGRFLMFNEAAARLFPLTESVLLPQQWAERLGFYHADGITPCQTEELPLVRSAAGESGRRQLLFVRNSLVPEGRMLQCSWQPIRGEGGVAAGLVVFTDVTELQRLQAEQAAQFEELRATQRKLIEAQRIGRVGNWELDLVSGRLWWSDEVYDLFGIERGEFDGTLSGFARWVHPDDQVLLKPARDAALRDGNVMNVEYRVLKPDGSTAWMHEIAETRRDEAGEPVWLGGVVQDITSRKQDEQALLDNQRELKGYTLMLQRAAEAAQAITARPSLEEALQEVADQACRVIGSGHAAVTLVTAEGGPGLRSFSGEERGPCASQGTMAVPLVSRTGQHIGELRLSGKHEGEFTRRHQYVAMELAQLACTAIENARLFAEIRELNASLEARIAERTSELARQEQLYRTLAEQAPEVVWNTNAAGTLTFLNRAWYDLVGGTPQDWIGQSGFAAIHPQDRAEVAANWRRCAEALSTFAGVRRIRAKNGAYHTMSYKAVPVLDEHGEVVFWVGIDADITDLKAIEGALRSSNQELEAFSYSVSHDLRAPLGAIGGFSRALGLKLEGHPDERVFHYLSRIQAGVGKMEQLIESLLSLARVVRAPLGYGPVDLSAMARESLENLQVQQPERVVAVRIQEALEVQGDARLLRLVMENLLGNAWKFTSRTQGALIEVGKLDNSRVFFVRDNGVGFDMAYAGKLFGAFQRLHTEAEFPGTGIGLATVRRIVARHQGRVWAESHPGLGTSFFFDLSESAPPAWLAADNAT